MKFGSLILTLSAAAMLAACASPTSRFYTLGGGDARPTPTAQASFYFELAPVDELGKLTDTPRPVSVFVPGSYARRSPAELSV